MCVLYCSFCRAGIFSQVSSHKEPNDKLISEISINWAIKKLKKLGLKSTIISSVIDVMFLSAPIF